MGLDTWLDSRYPRLPTWEILGREITGVISWNMNDSCNYRCSYCTQRHMPDRSGSLERVSQTLAAFESLPGHWEFKLSGGEPFQQPRLDEIIAGLVQMGHVISVQTNFSASPERLQSFLEVSRGALHVFSASLHLEYATPQDFLERYQCVRPYEPQGLRFHVTSVAIPDRLTELRDHVEPFFRQHGIVFKVQPEKVGGYLRSYSEPEQEILMQLGGHNQTGQIAHNFQGQLCYSGVNYIVIKSTGEAYRCYPASRVGGRFSRLGSLTEGIQLLDGPRLCPYTYCNCTVPIQRGMIDQQFVETPFTHSVPGNAEDEDVHQIPKSP